VHHIDAAPHLHKALHKHNSARLAHDGCNLKQESSRTKVKLGSLAYTDADADDNIDR